MVYLRLLYSREVEGNEYTLRDDLNNTLKEALGFLDPNVVNWISSNSGLRIKDDGEKTLVRLKGDGVTKAFKVLEEVYDENLNKELMCLIRSQDIASKSANKTDASEKSAKSSGKSRQKNKDAEEWIIKWNDLKLNIDLFGIAKDLSPRDKVVLALWVINKATNGAVEATKTTKISHIITNLFFASGSRQNLDQALKKGYPNYLQKTPNGSRITPDGKEHVEKMVETSTNK